MKQILVNILFFLGLSVNLLAQTAVDTINLSEVTLVESRLYSHNIGTNFEIINPEIIGVGNSQTLSDFLTTKTLTISPDTSWGTPMAAASKTPSCIASTSSTSLGYTLKPETIIMSFLRSTI